MSDPPQNPAGEFVPPSEYSEQAKSDQIAILRDAPTNLRTAIGGLSEEQLDTLYRNWTIRQIVHHLSDSHLNSLMRFKWTLAENEPTIKAYEEGDWVELADAKTGAVDPALALLTGIHAKWVQVLEGMTESQFRRGFLHPQTGNRVDLWEALHSYAWHSRHHTAQILWVREQHGL